MTAHLKIVIIILAGICINFCQAQILDAGDMIQLQLSEGTQLVVAKKVSGWDDTEQVYYYLPVNIQFSRTKNNDPEFSFLTYKEGTEITGGILHFLIKWGLNPTQLKEADSLLKIEKGEDIRFMGAAMPEIETLQQEIKIEGNSTIAEILNNSKSTIGKTANLPNTKMAASFQLNKEDAIKFQQILSNNSSELEDVYLVLYFQLKYKEPGIPGISKTNYKLEQNLKNLLNQ